MAKKAAANEPAWPEGWSVTKTRRRWIVRHEPRPGWVSRHWFDTKPTPDDILDRQMEALRSTIQSVQEVRRSLLSSSPAGAAP